MLSTRPRIAVAVLATLIAVSGSSSPDTAALQGDVAASPEASRSERDARAAERAAALYAIDEERGELAIEAAFVLTAAWDEGQRGLLELLVDLESLPRGADAADLELALVLDRRDGGLLIEHRRVTAEGLGGVAWWAYQTPLVVPAETRDITLVVELPAAGLWGAAPVELVDEAPERPEATASTLDRVGWSLVPRPAPPSPSPAARRASGRSAIRLLPPRRRQLSGPTEIETLIGTQQVAKAVFYLDGTEVATDDEPPFAARVTLAGPGTPQAVRVVALAAGGGRLGEDEVTLNEVDRPFRVALTRVDGSPEAGALEVAAEVSVPPGARLDRVELYWNAELAATLEEPPFSARVPVSGSTGTDFVRATAYLEDGTFVEDVRLMGAGGIADEVDVNLVELYVVVSDRDGGPVRDLPQDAFTVRLGGRRQRIERFTYAEDVPLVLGLVIDTSGSMQFMMNEVRQAATQFLTQVLSEGDRAFLVDFDTLPRLAHPTTGDQLALIESFRSLRADGYTALFDAILYSMLEFDAGRGRKALVLLTDGDDYRSSFGVRRCVALGNELGVPVYVIALGGEPDPGGGPPALPGMPQRMVLPAIGGNTKMELEAVTGRTGGRLYTASGADELARAYAEIDAELRSQYLITFYSQGELTPDQRRKVEVDVRGRGLEARTVVSPE